MSRSHPGAGDENPFEDPSTIKSLPNLPNHESGSDQSNSSQSRVLKRGTPPLPSYLQFGSRSYRPSTERKDAPSVKEMAANFERETSGPDLASNNPYRGQDAQETSVAETPVSNNPSPKNQNERVTSVLSTCSFSAGPGPDLGPINDQLGEKVELGNAVSGETFPRPCSSEYPNDSYLNHAADHFSIGEDSPASSDGVDRYAAYTSSPPRAEATEIDGNNHQATYEQGFPSSPLVPPPRSFARGHYGEASGSTKIGTDSGEHYVCSVADCVPPLPDPFLTQGNASILRPSGPPYKTLRTEEHVDIRTVLEERPPIPPKSKNRQPLFNKRLNLPVNSRRDNGGSLNNALQLSAQARSAATPQQIIAKRAADKLEAQRHMMETPIGRRDYTQLSPSAMRLALELSRKDGVPFQTGGRAVGCSVWLWGTLVICQCSIISTAAAIAVVVVRMENASGSSEAIGSGLMFWLVISVVVFVGSGVTVLFIWARCKGFFSTFQKKLGLEEIGLLDRVLKTTGDANNADVKGNAASVHHPAGVLETSRTQTSMASSHWPPSMYVEPRSTFNDGYTPSRLHASPSGFSPAPIHEPSPISPVEPTHLKQVTRYPVHANDHSEQQQPNNFPPGRFGKQPEKIRISNHRGGKSEVIASNSPLEDLHYGLKMARSAPESQRLSVVESHRAVSIERSHAMRESIGGPSKLRRTTTFDSNVDVSHQTVITEEADAELKPNGSRSMSQTERYSLQLQLESIGKELNQGGRQLPRSRNIPNLAAQAGSQYRTSAVGMDEHDTELSDFNDQASSTYGSMPQSPAGESSKSNGKGKERETGDMSRGRSFLNGVREHFTEQHGRSVGSIIRDHHAKNKDGSPF